MVKNELFDRCNLALFGQMLSPNSYLRTLRLKSFAKQIPHPEKAHFGGEDSWFIAPNNRVVGVADGVGGWANVKGSDPSRVSRELMGYSSMFSDMKGPDKILDAAFEKLDKTIIGTTTATVVELEDKTLSTVNLGDSGCRVFRNGKLVFESSELTHAFNFPFQLGYTSRDKPADAKVESIDVEEGDYVVTATDGVWDNLFNEDISKMIISLDQAESIAEAIAKEANKNGADRNYNSPFAEEAKKLKYHFQGGKLDDVTVIVSKVIQ